jgi:D-alanine-D-alanine ligase
MTDKIRVGILFGGKSAEHEISLQSARNVVEAIDKSKYEPVLIGIDKTGRWLLDSGSQKLLASIVNSGDSIALIPQSDGQITHLANRSGSGKVDVIFPVLHGPFGEDGTVQGLLKLANVPFVGASVLGSAIGMDKDVMKRLLRDADIPIGHFRTCLYGETPEYAGVVSELGLPLFVKPANLGSSVGISKVHDEQEYVRAMSEAFRFDRKLLIEEFIPGREIECAVLGNEEPVASVPGEIHPQHEFYSYEAKYQDEHGAILDIPAKLDPATVRRVQALAVKTFQVLCCEGMARVDSFLCNDGSLLVNEINTIPGFTAISMYPKLWAASGISYTELIDRLIQLAIDRFRNEQRLRTSYLE